MRGAMAFTSSLLKRKLVPNSSSPSSLFSRLSHRCHATVDTEAEKRSSSILGPDHLPDIWTLLSSTVPPYTLFIQKVTTFLGGALTQTPGPQPLFIPCAAKACVGLLQWYQIDLMGKHAVVIGLLTSLLLQGHHAPTVSIVHAYTPNPEEILREANIIISAAGVANLVRGSWLKSGVVVIDVSTNPIEDSDSQDGTTLLETLQQNALSATGEYGR